MPLADGPYRAVERGSNVGLGLTCPGALENLETFLKCGWICTVLTPYEVEQFEQYLRPRIESGQGTKWIAQAYLWAMKGMEEQSSRGGSTG
jgi:hypothetical protein